MLDQPIDRITLRPEYGCDVPLWGGGGNLDVETCQQLGLSADLIERLLAWQSAFDADFRWERGWTTGRSDRAPWRAQADLLTADIRRALPTVEVAVDLWCVPRWWWPWRRRR